MKRISTLLLSAAMLFGTVGAAQAVDIKAKGQFEFVFGWGKNLGGSKGFNSNAAHQDFIARQRVRTQVNFIASEFLQGVLMFEIGDTDWGRTRNGNTGPSSGGALDADGVNVETKRAYIDWIVPNTDLSIRMGIQGLALPSATRFNNPVFDADVAAITASYKFNDMFALTGFWARPFDAYNDRYADNGNGRRLDDSVDMFGLVAPITGEGWALTPWTVMANIGNQSGYAEYIMAKDNLNGLGRGIRDVENDRAFAWWLGTGFELTMFDPLTFGMDVMYGRMGDLEGLNVGARPDGVANPDNNFTARARGWFLDARLDYKLDWATAGIFGWWSTGDDAEDQRYDANGNMTHAKLGRMPVVGVDTGFAPTSFGFSGTKTRGDDNAVSQTGMGTWGIGVQLADMSFIDDLKHTLRVSYYKGTNDRDLARGDGPFGSNTRYGVDSLYLTTGDAAWEVNFDHQYKIYENLTAYLELGYINLDLIKNHFQSDSDDAWKAQVGFKYEF
ncbi:outer membrane homotrimeric porin [Desulfovibrio cuneatus]|uniref:outer membrane homotrimeric porin n=1 Tax=Desulfovibrio cuneatus TaxID=159728 RepID=UPI0003FF2702|nr:outer membrane homotrimeric porin [Desulfovibrio cuneatus]